LLVCILFCSVLFCRYTDTHRSVQHTIFIFMFISTLQLSIDVDHYQAFSKNPEKQGKILLYSSFWAIPRRLNFMCRRFGTLCPIFIGRANKKNNRDVPVILPAYNNYEDGTKCSETSAHKIQKPGNHPKETMQHSEHGESLKSRIKCYCL